MPPIAWVFTPTPMAGEWPKMSLWTDLKRVGRTAKKTWKGYRTHVHPSVRSVNHRHRHVLYPLEIGVLLLLYRYVAADQPPSVVFALSMLVAAGVVYLLRRSLDRRVEWVYALSCLGAAILGLTLVSVVGLDNSTLNAFCVLAWGGASVIWWQHHSIRPTKRPINDKEVIFAQLNERFETRIGQTRDVDNPDS